MENLEELYKQIIQSQRKGQLTGEQFLQLKELQALTKVLNDLEKQYREAVDYRMSL